MQRVVGFGSAPRGDVGYSSLAMIGDVSHAIEDTSLRAVCADVCGFRFSEPLPPSAAAHVTRIERTDTAVASLSGLEYFTGLEVLELRARDVADLSPLTALSGLRCLTLHDTNICDLAPLGGLRDLRAVSLVDAPVCDIAALAGLERLEMVVLTGSGVSDLSPLNGCHHLRVLNLDDTPVQDLDMVAGCVNLVELRLARTLVRDLGALGCLTKLETLVLSGTKISDLKPLTTMRHLSTLHIDGVATRCDIDVVLRLDGLRHLRVDSRQNAALAGFAGPGPDIEIGVSALSHTFERVSRSRRARLRRSESFSSIKEVSAMFSATSSEVAGLKQR